MAYQAPRPFAVLLTRPLLEAQRIAPDLEALGGEVMIAPLSIIEPLPLPSSLPPFDAIIMTSQNAFAALDRYTLKAPFYCVGERTATLLRQKGYEVKQEYATAEQLLADLQGTPAAYLHFAGVHKAIDFSQALANCATIEVYQAQAVKQLPLECTAAFKAKKIDWVLVYSRRSAEILGQHLSKIQVSLKQTNVMAISTKAAEPLKQLGFKKIYRAITADHHGMLTSLRTSLENEGIFYG